MLLYAVTCYSSRYAVILCSLLRAIKGYAMLGYIQSTQYMGLMLLRVMRAIKGECYVTLCPEYWCYVGYA